MRHVPITTHGSYPESGDGVPVRRGRRENRLPTPAAISIENLVKTFGRTRALDGLDLEVETGEVHGFLGPNGAGQVDDHPGAARAAARGRRRGPSARRRPVARRGRRCTGGWPTSPAT